ncbi:MAG: RNA polymerase sigma factor [Vicinamibacteria bacterium]
MIEAGRQSYSSPLRFPVPGEREARRREDEILVERVRRGEIEAFEQLYRRHSSAIFGLALRMLQNRADAEDMLQEIFLQAYDRLPSFEGRSAFATWLYRLSVNRCLDHLRSRGAKEQNRTDPLSPELPERSSSPGGFSGIVALELERAIGELPPSSRAAFLLHHVAGYDHKEVGEILGVAVGTSKSLVHRARTRLRGILTK